jgi:hypothetical protein
VVMEQAKKAICVKWIAVTEASVITRLVLVLVLRATTDRHVKHILFYPPKHELNKSFANR